MGRTRPRTPKTALTLIAGPYQPPRCRPGDWLDDEILGRVKVMGWTDAPLSWPRIRRKGPAGPVLTAELARAVRTESAAAVAHWWGMSKDQVRKLRQALDVDRVTEGTRRVLQENRAAMPPDVAARATAQLQTPQVRERSAAARRGRPASDALRAAALRGARQPKSPEWSARAHQWMEAGKARKRRHD